MANETHFIVFFRLGWDTVESSMYIVEQELDFLRVRNSPNDWEGAICSWLRFLTRPSNKCINRVNEYMCTYCSLSLLHCGLSIMIIYLLWMDCFDFSIKSVSVVGCSDGSSSQSSGSLSEICCKLPMLSSCRTWWLLFDPGPPGVYSPPWPGCDEIPAFPPLKDKRYSCFLFRQSRVIHS